MSSFVVLGVGDAFSAKYYSACLLLEHEGRRILYDCPHPIRKMLAEAGASLNEKLDLDSIDGVALTHLHADHCSGVEGYGYFSFFLLKRKGRLAMHPDVAARLWDGHLAAGMEHLGVPGTNEARNTRLDDFFDVTALDATKPVEFGPFRIECRRTIHHVPTTAFLIHAGDRTLGLSADTSFDPSLIEWLARADLIVHETNYGIHTPYAKLLELPEELRRKMRLIHYPDNHDVDGSAIEALRQGRRYTF